jgi:hypothetical protein
LGEKALRNFLKKKAVAVAIVGFVVVGGSIAAFAYWTTGGSGTGSAATGTTANITAVQTSTITGLRPGGSAQTLSGNFTNTTNSGGTVYVTSVTASISSVTGGDGACDATDYTLANAVMTVGADIPAGTAQGAWTGATIQFNNKITNQDGCKNATVNLAYAIA